MKKYMKSENTVIYVRKFWYDKNEKSKYEVRDHCHYTGKFRGATHNICNLRYKIQREIPVVLCDGQNMIFI